MDKKDFVNYHLTALFRVIERSDIKRLEYHRVGADEYVKIIFNSNETTLINVSADSEIAIIQDIIKAL